MDFKVDDQPVQLTGYSDSNFLTSCSVDEVENFVFEVNSYGQDVIEGNNEIAELYGLNSAAKDTLGVEVILVDMGFEVTVKLNTGGTAVKAMSNRKRTECRDKAC